jgi:hypothetical protein
MKVLLTATIPNLGSRENYLPPVTPSATVTALPVPTYKIVKGTANLNDARHKLFVEEIGAGNREIVTEISVAHCA